MQARRADRHGPIGGHGAGAARFVGGLARRLGVALGALTLSGVVLAAPLRHEVLDDFRQPAAWAASASDQVRAALRPERDGSLCLDYDFGAVSGYAVMRRALPVQWPEHFDLVARVKAIGATNDLQIKLVDASGDNVWWSQRPNAVLPATLSDLKIRRRQIEFAWGPTADRTLRSTRHVEFVVAAGRDGGRGSLCVARLVLAEREPDPVHWPAPQILSDARAMDVDWVQTREFNGLALRWPAAQPAGFDYDVLGSDDGREWRVLRRVRRSDGGLDALWLPDSEARFLRIALPNLQHAAAAPMTASSPRANAANPATSRATARTAPKARSKAATKAATKTPAKARSKTPPSGRPGARSSTGAAGRPVTVAERSAWASFHPVARRPSAPRRAALGAARGPKRGAAPARPPAIALQWPAVELREAARWPTLDAMLAELAADAPRGDLPRAYRGEQNYWTLVGVDGGGERSALLDESGAIEVGRGGFSVEPSLRLADGTRLTWAQVTATQTLRDDGLPLPRVHWSHPAVELTVEAGADGPRHAPQLLARYVLRNPGPAPQSVVVSLAVRPWQVNPPQQFLATPGGASPIRMLRYGDGVLAVDERRRLRFAPAPQRAGALTFDSGLSLAALQAAPPLTVIGDPAGHASAMLDFPVTLAPGASATVGWTAPLAAGAEAPAPLDAAALDRRLEAVAAHWRERLHRTTLQLPPEARPIADTLRTALAHILISRDGAALRPGTRSYNRSWIRDGAMMVAGLVRLGEAEAAREFIDWYQTQVFASGKVPCCVDRRGADPVVENDSHGQYLFAVAEVWRHTRDLAFLQRHWPTVQRVVAWMEALRQSERGAANRTPERAHLFGLLPPSISHEGYSDKPAYSYWDDFWALRGYKDAVVIARALQQAAPAARWAEWRDEFQRELKQSIAATAQRHRLAVIAGAADRGDFDPTSTTIALNPAQADVDPGLLAATFERYWQEMSARSDGRRPYADYTPYELRTVGALARLGWPERAHAMLDFFFRDQRPRGWNQWAEVVLPEARRVRFLGDMPHAWVASDFVRSALDLLAYEREDDESLVVGAGLRPAWLTQGEPIELRGLSTAHGRFDLRIARHAVGWTLELPRRLEGLRGGVRLRWPDGLARPRARHGAIELAWDDRGELRLPDGPATVELLADGPARR